MKTTVLQSLTSRAALAAVALSLVAPFSVTAQSLGTTETRAADASGNSGNFFTSFTWAAPVSNAPGSQHDLVLDYVSDPARRDASAAWVTQLSVVAAPIGGSDAAGLATGAMAEMHVASGADPNGSTDSGDQVAHRYRLMLHIETPADTGSAGSTVASYLDLGPEAAPYDTPLDLSEQISAQSISANADAQATEDDSAAPSFADISQFYVRMAAWSASGITTVRSLSVDGGAFAIPRELGTGRLTNVSARAQVGIGNDVLIAGYVTSGSDPKNLLVRGIGPGLAAFGITGALSSTSLTYFNQAGLFSASDDQGWGSESNADLISGVAAEQGAFALTPSSLDSATYFSVPSGAYTTELAGAANNTGLGLIEVYDADAGVDSGKIVNFSARAQVGTGDKIVIAGFNVQGLTPRTLLLRGVGPTLGSLGLTGTFAQPAITLYNNGAVIAQNTGWGTAANADAIRTATPEAGAFTLPEGSADSAILVTLNPGTYTLQVSGAKGAGAALTEIYDLTQE
jgi:hypothetical protein